MVGICTDGGSACPVSYHAGAIAVTAGLSDKDKIELWEKHDGKCWRCGLPIDKYKRGELHWGHVLAKSLGGSDKKPNRAPEHARCNLESAYKTEIPVAAKVKRVGGGILEPREPKMRLSRKMDGTVCRWNPKTRKYDIVVGGKR